MGRVKYVYNTFIAGPVNSAVRAGVDAIDSLLGPYINFGPRPDILPRLAKGGIALGPTLALIGESPFSRGEAIIPLERLNEFVNQGVSSTTVNLVVQIGERDITDIVDARVSNSNRGMAQASMWQGADSGSDSNLTYGHRNDGHARLSPQWDAGVAHRGRIRHRDRIESVPHRLGQRSSRGNRGPGLQDIPPNTIKNVVDYEIPVGCLHRYIFGAWLDGELIDAVTVEPPETLRDDCGQVRILRDLLNPQETIDISFCFGVFEEMAYAVRAGVFNVIGRRYPSLLPTAWKWGRGTLRFISHNRDELYDLRRLLTEAASPLLFQLEHMYELGRSGVFYIMPMSVTERWLPYARLPQHVFEAEIVEISPPPLSEVITKSGIPFDVVIGDATFPNGGLKQRYTAYTELSLSGQTYSEVFFDEP